MGLLPQIKALALPRGIGSDLPNGPTGGKSEGHDIETPELTASQTRKVPRAPGVG
jgi:hypothetical protein